jgi:predicted metalloendopeptidase
MKRFLLPVYVVGAAAALGACSGPDAPDAAAQKGAAAQPVAPVAKPVASGVALGNFDPAVRPQDDFYRHVNGAWLAKTEIPADKSNYGSFTILSDEAEKDLRAIIEEAAQAKDNPPGSEAQKVGDLYASYMDEAKVEELGLTPIADELAAIDALADKAALVEHMGVLARAGVQGMLIGYVNTDAKNSDRYAFYLYQAGIGLPDRDYFLDEKYRDKLAAYTPHVEKMLSLAGIPDAGRRAAAIVKFETTLAKSHWTKVDSRDDTKTYNPKTLDELAQLAPGIDFKRYFTAMGVADPGTMIVNQPSYVTGMAKAIDATALETLKDWLKWSVINQYASLLHKDMVDADFAFYGTTLKGTPENRPRWKRAVEAVEVGLGEAVGKIYVEKHFPPEAKRRMDALVKNLVEAYRQGIRKLEWMGPETKEKALAKLAQFNPKIGYPNKWRDYGKLEIRRDDLVGNIQRAAVFEFQRNLDKLGGPVDRDEWFMTPQTVNAYYNPGMNEIVFPAAILQPPFFNMAADEAVNYGAIGSVIGHEIGHGFDDQGSKWDGKGNLVDWWTAEDRAEFEKRGKALVAQYAEFEPLPGFRVNGALTLGENIGDLAGVTFAHAAYVLSLGGKEPPVLDGFTGDQRFLIGWAQVWARKYRDDDLKSRIALDPHAPSEYRTNGIMRNLPVFYAAFDVKEGDRLYLPPEQRVKIW